MQTLILVDMKDPPMVCLS